MRTRVFSASLIILLGTSLGAQDDDHVTDLAFWADVMTNASRSAHRLQAADSFELGIQDLLASRAPDELLVEQLEWIRFLAPPDSSFWILTWLVAVDENSSKYYGIIKQADGALLTLDDTRPLRSEYASHDAETWYGAIYYGILPFSWEGDNVYVLLGFDAHNDRTNKRVADVMRFQEGSIVFDAGIFPPPGYAEDQDMKRRIITEYADGTNGQMKFDFADNTLIFDNIIIHQSGPEGPIPVPDGSYKSYTLTADGWRYTDKVFNQIQDTPPGDGQAGDVGDLFGTRKKN